MNTKTRKTILLLTNWYPEPENPLKGIFFREQMLALKEYFDFLVVRYAFGCNVIRHYREARFLGEEENIREYSVRLVTRTVSGRLSCWKEDAAYIRDLKFQKELVALFRDTFPEGIDLLYTIDAQVEAGLLKVLSDGLRIPYVVGEHGIVPWPGTAICRVHLEGMCAASMFLAISHDKVRQVMMQGITLPEVRYVGNLADDSLFRYKPSGNDVRTFIAVGAHVIYKNYDMLIAVMNRLTEITSVPFRLIIVGYAANKGYSKAPELLEQKIRSSKFADFTEMIPHLKRENMPALYNRADAFIMTSFQEGQPVAALEAGCSGLPVFSTRCGGVEDYVTEDIGRVFPLFDAELFAEGLKQYLEGTQKYNHEHICSVIRGMFGRKAFTENMTKAFYDAIERSTHSESSMR